jgi:ATP-binding protein involved in chromosome partitioning
MSETGDGLLFEREDAKKKLERVGRVILVGSGKGGVGKSFVASGLALALARAGHRTGILDLDIHGASLPAYFGVSPPLTSTKKGLKPKVKEGIEIMSVALFTGNRPVPIRGSEKQNLVNEIFALTDWGRLEYLVVDLPPTTGDEVLSAFSLFGSKSVLILVTTPSPLAVSIVSRLRQLASGEGIPIRGVVINMAYLKKGKTKSFPFGRPNRPSMEKQLNSKVLAEIPLDEGVSSKGLIDVLRGKNEISAGFKRLATTVVARQRSR